MSLLRLETARASASNGPVDSMRAVPTSPRPFVPSNAPVGADDPAARRPRMSSARIALLVSGAALVVILVLVAMTR